MSGVVYVNDIDVESITGVTIANMEQWASGIRFARPGIGVPGRVGQIVAAGQATAEPRVVTLALLITAATVAARDAVLTSVMDLFHGIVELRFGDAPDKVIEGVLSSESVAGAAGRWAFAFPDLLLTLEIICHDPSKRDRYVQSAAFGASAIAIPLGTLASVGTILIMGAATNPVLTYRSGSGLSVQTMSFTATLTTAEYLEIDLARETVARVSSGTRVVNLALWTAGDFPVLDPADGAATLEVTPGSAILYHHRRWRS